MGGKIRAQKKGRSRRYRSPNRRSKYVSQYKEGRWKILDIVHSIGRPMIKVGNGKDTFYMIAPENVGVGDEIVISNDAQVSPGNVLPLEKIPEGTPIFNIEGVPGDNGSFVRSSGCFGVILSKGKKCIVQFPSRKTREFNPKCKATIGIVAGSGRVEKPIVKAGIKYKMMKAKGKLYAVTSGTAMNPVDHPFGGKTKPGIPKTVSRHAPPGAKVGSIAAKRTGRKKR